MERVRKISSSGLQVREWNALERSQSREWNALKRSQGIIRCGGYLLIAGFLRLLFGRLLLEEGVVVHHPDEADSRHVGIKAGLVHEVRLIPVLVEGFF